MARLTARARRRLPAKAFAYPPKKGVRAKGRYPIHDRNHAIVALREASKSTTFGSYRHVRNRVCSKHPTLPTCRRGR